MKFPMKNKITKILYNFMLHKNRDQIIRYGSFFGRLFYYLIPSWRKLVKKNLEILGADCSRKSVKNVFKNNFTSFVEIFFIPKIIDEQFIVNYVDIVNEEEVRDFIKNNKKYVIVSAFTGCWELAPTLFAKVFKTDVVVIGKKAKWDNFNDMNISLRNNRYVEYLQDIHNLKDIYGYLDNNVPVWLLLDHGIKKERSIFADLLGLRMFFNAAIATICIRKDIPAIPSFCIRENKSIKLLNYPPIFPDKKLDLRSRIRQFANGINAVYEDVIKKYPDQVLHLYKQLKRMGSENDTKTNSIS